MYKIDTFITVKSYETRTYGIYISIHICIFMYAENKDPF
jgi:hypothetical protein